MRPCGDPARRMRLAALAVIAAALTAGVSCAHIDGDPDPADPWERMNRGIFRFNEGADRWVFEPIAKGMDFVIPDPVERSIRKFFENSMIPVHFGTRSSNSSPCRPSKTSLASWSIPPSESRASSIPPPAFRTRGQRRGFRPDPRVLGGSTGALSRIAAAGTLQPSGYLRPGRGFGFTRLSVVRADLCELCDRRGPAAQSPLACTRRDRSGAQSGFGLLCGGTKRLHELPGKPGAGSGGRRGG